MKYLEGLNEKQKEAVLHTKGPLLILAGAGAGKTKTMTHRILHLVTEGVLPKEILAVTFTNKAAKEMNERLALLFQEYKIAERLEGRGGAPFIGTFHSLGIKILRENADKVGLPRHFGIFDRDDSKRAVREAEKELGYDPKQWEPNKILGIISKEKGELRTAEDFVRKANKDYTSQAIAVIWPMYEKILAREKSVDFDDLLLKSTLILKNNESVRTHYQNLWKYIHVDEYQDTNAVQYEISRLLAGETRNICVVGDGDQNIYSWRGANIKNIINFEEDYQNAHTILLEENYRSTQNILTAANRIIAKNKIRKDKNLFTKNSQGEKLSLYGAYMEGDEASFIARTSADVIASGTEPQNIAVLYRANFQSRALEEAFLASGLPYQLLGTRFYDRKEVKDVLAFVRASRNPDNRTDLERIINIPARGIGKVTLEKILAGQEENLPPTMKQKLAQFRGVLEKISTASETMKPSALIKFLIKESGMEKMLEEDKDGGEERLENIGELVTLATKYDTMPEREGIEKLLEDAALATDQDSLIERKNGVKLMTVHASKGLEFDYVFISGLEDNLFPHKRLYEEKLTAEESEEERRLFYVALTRARKKIYLTYASSRTIFGQTQVNIPSEFLSDIGEDLLLSENEEPPKGKVVYFD